MRPSARWPRLWDIRVATWRFPRAGGEDGEQAVVLEHNYLTTRQVVTLDGIRKADRTPVRNLENRRHAFRCCVRYCLCSRGGEERTPATRANGVRPRRTAIASL